MISDEALDAAAEAIYDKGHIMVNMTEAELFAQVALEAAAPILKADALREAEAAAKLDEEAEALYRARWGEGAVTWEMLVPKADWRNVARAARKLYAPNKTPEVTR